MKKLSVLALLLLTIGIFGSILLYPYVASSKLATTDYTAGRSSTSDILVGFLTEADLTVKVGGPGISADTMFAVYGEQAAPYGVFIAALPALLKIASLLGVIIAAVVVFRRRQSQNPMYQG